MAGFHGGPRLNTQIDTLAHNTTLVRATRFSGLGGGNIFSRSNGPNSDCTSRKIVCNQRSLIKISVVSRDVLIHTGSVNPLDNGA